MRFSAHERVAESAWMRRVLVALLLGHITSWVSSNYLTSMTGWMRHRNGLAQVAEETYAHPDEAGLQYQSLRFSWGRQLLVFSRPEMGSASLSRRLPPRWTESRRAVARRSFSVPVAYQASDRWIERGAGWPFICVRSITVSQADSAGVGPGKTTTTAGSYADRHYTIGAPQWLTDLSPHEYPQGDLVYRPWWPGLMMNTIVYGLLWLSGLSLPALVLTVRSAVRHRRGCCPMCAYDLRPPSGFGCPECGWNREQASKARSDRPASDLGDVRS